MLTAAALTSTGADTVALFRTTDGGQTWRPYQNGFGRDTEAKRVLAMADLTGESSTLLATGGSAVVAKSDDAGLTWHVVWGGWQVGAVGMHLMVVDSRRLGSVWVGSEGGYFQPLLLHSEDFGETWHEIRINIVGDNAHYSLAVDRMSSDVVFTGMEGRVLKSTDGGPDVAISPKTQRLSVLLRPRLQPRKSRARLCSGSATRSCDRPARTTAVRDERCRSVAAIVSG